MLGPKMIYPNFNKDIKWLGIIEYKALVILGIYSTIIWTIMRLITQNIFVSLYVTFILTIPVFVIFYSNLSQDNVYDILKMVIRFVLSRKRYVYKFGNKKYKVDI